MQALVCLVNLLNEHTDFFLGLIECSFVLFLCLELHPEQCFSLVHNALLDFWQFLGFRLFGGLALIVETLDVDLGVFVGAKFNADGGWDLEVIIHVVVR